MKIKPCHFKINFNQLEAREESDFERCLRSLLQWLPKEKVVRFALACAEDDVRAESVRSQECIDLVSRWLKDKETTKLERISICTIWFNLIYTVIGTDPVYHAIHVANDSVNYHKGRDSIYLDWARALYYDVTDEHYEGTSQFFHVKGYERVSLLNDFLNDHGNGLVKQEKDQFVFVGLPVKIGKTVNEVIRKIAEDPFVMRYLEDLYKC